MMRKRLGRPLAVAVMLAVGACSSSPEPAGAPAPESGAAATSSATPTDLTPTILKILAGEAEPFTNLQPGTYALDPDLNPSTPLRVSWEIPAKGWQTWIGAAKFSDAGWSPVSITTVSNLVTHGCHDHSWADPPVGPSVDELAAALTHLAPFRVTSSPEDVSIYGYHGKYLELTVPNLPVSDDGTFTTCAEGNLKSWVAAIDAGEAGDAFYGYTGPGFTEEFWILDVEGTRLMISAGTSPGSPSEDLAELRAILDSIRIEP